MAKELPYFKFEPGQWENGTIQICSREDKGLFIDLCSMYWQRLGDLPYKLAVQKLCAGNATAMESIIDEEVITIIDGMIYIDFLNEQLREFEKIREKNSENALIGWKKRKKDATVMRPHSERNAIREDKRREDKMIDIKQADSYSSPKEANEDMVKDELFIESAVRALQNAGWRTVTNLDISALIYHFTTGKAKLNEHRDNVKQHFRNWILSTETSKLQTLSINVITRAERSQA